MKNLSKEFRRALYNDERNYLAYADITLADNTVLNLTNSEIWTGGFSYEESVSEDNSFTAVGSAIMGSATLIINNINDTYSTYDFTNAQVVLYIGMQFVEDSDTRLEKLKIGTYSVDETNYNGATIRLSLLDYMEQFDRPYSLSSLTYPATLDEIVRNACTSCGVTLSTNSYNFPNYSLSIPTRPEDEAITFREVLSWVATIAGCFLKCNPNGQLELKWFDINSLTTALENIDGGTFNPWNTGTSYNGGTFNPWNTGTSYDGGTFIQDPDVHYLYDLYSQSVSLDDVVITGVSVQVKNEEENAQSDMLTYSTGTSGYVIELQENGFITTTNAQSIINFLGSQLIGLRFRKFTITQASDPAIEAGDVGILIDRKQNIYPTLITRVNFSADSQQTVVCGADTPLRNSAKRFSAATKSYVESRKLLKQEQTIRQQAVQTLTDALASSSGLYTTISSTQSGDIFYLHDKSTLSNSKIVWKMTSEAWGVTNDWQGTDAATTQANKWNAGMTVDGTVIANILSTIGLDFDWGVGGSLQIKKNNVETFYANADTGVVRIVADSFSLSNGDTINSIANSAASSAVNAQTQQSIFNKLTNNGQTQGIYLSNSKIYINASYISTGTLADANNNTVFNLSTGALTMKKGSINIGNGQFVVDTSGNLTSKSATLNGSLRTASGGSYVSVINGKISVGDVVNNTDTERCAILFYTTDSNPGIWLRTPNSYGLFAAEEYTELSNQYHKVKMNSTGIEFWTKLSTNWWKSVYIDGVGIHPANGSNTQDVYLPAEPVPGVSYYHLKVKDGILTSAS